MQGCEGFTPTTHPPTHSPDEPETPSTDHHQSRAQPLDKNHTLHS